MYPAISQSACGAIATVIPVLLLAGLLGSGTIRVIRHDRAIWRVWYLCLIAIGVAAVIGACIGANEPAGLTGGSSALVWFGLFIASFYLLLESILRLFAPESLFRAPGA